MKKRWVLICALFFAMSSLFSMSGCRSKSQPAVTQNSYLMDSSAFRVDIAASLLKSGKVANADDLQSAVNDPEAGINNVDLDHDGNVDPITVSEEVLSGVRRFTFVAHPATKPEAPIVASVDLTEQGSQVVVSAGYPTYVRGYDRDYYTYSIARDLAFMSWVYGMHRPVYFARDYRTYGWYSAGPRPVLAAPMLETHRSSYTTRTQVSPLTRAAPPKTYAPPATKMPSGFAARPLPPRTDNLSDRSHTRGFEVRDHAKPKEHATGFGAKPNAPAAAPAPPRVAPARPAAPPPRSFPRAPSAPRAAPRGR